MIVKAKHTDLNSSNIDCTYSNLLFSSFLPAIPNAESFFVNPDPIFCPILDTFPESTMFKISTISLNQSNDFKSSIFTCENLKFEMLPASMTRGLFCNDELSRLCSVNLEDVKLSGRHIRTDDIKPLSIILILIGEI